jgi:UDP-xylose/UDP-N-acetylglucosamine transporter B4
MLVAASLSVLLGCCLNVISLEYVTKYDAGAGHLLTLAQFAFVAFAALAWPFARALVARCTCGFLFGADAATWPPVPFSQPLTLPLRAHLQMAVAFFALSVINNKALDFHISMPLHMIFRSSSLVATLLVGALFMRRRYTFGQWFGCALVSIGILVATVADAVSRGKLNLGGLGACCGGSSGGSISGVTFESLWSAVKETVESFELTWLMGVGLLSIALLLTSFLSFVQEMNFKAHGKNADGIVDRRYSLLMNA